MSSNLVEPITSSVAVVGVQVVAMPIGLRPSTAAVAIIAVIVIAVTVGRRRIARIKGLAVETEDLASSGAGVQYRFGQLQAVNLESIEPSLRADTEVTAAPREDMPEVFKNREAILAEIPSYVDPYIKVPKILNKE